MHQGINPMTGQGCSRIDSKSCIVEVRQITSSLQSPRISADRQGVDLVPLLEEQPDAVSSVPEPYFWIYCCPGIREAIAVPPDHKIYWIRMAAQVDSGTGRRGTPPEADLTRDSRPDIAAQARPVSLLAGQWKITSPVRASRKEAPKEKIHGTARLPDPAGRGPYPIHALHLRVKPCGISPVPS